MLQTSSVENKFILLNISYNFPIYDIQYNVHPKRGSVKWFKIFAGKKKEIAKERRNKWMNWYPKEKYLKHVFWKAHEVNVSSLKAPSSDFITKSRFTKLFFKTPPDRNDAFKNVRCCITLSSVTQKLLSFKLISVWLSKIINKILNHKIQLDLNMWTCYSFTLQYL